MKVLVIDDLTAVRVRLKEMLAAVEDIDLLGVAQDAKQATELALAWKPDVLVLDIRMRGGRGIDVLQAVKSARPATVVIISTIFSGADDRKAWLKRGADFFFDKSTEFETIAGVLRNLKLRTPPAPGGK